MWNIPRPKPCPRRNRHRRLGSVEALEERLLFSSTRHVPERIELESFQNARDVSHEFNSAYLADGSATIAQDEIDYYRFFAPEDGVYQFSATTPASNLDTVLAVFAADGRRIAVNDDIAWPNLDSRAYTLLDRGSEYIFAITNYTGTPGGSYNWDVQRTDDWYEAWGGDSRQNAIVLPQVFSTRQVLPGLVMADGHDWYEFDLRYSTLDYDGGTVEIRFEHALGDLDMHLYDAQGRWLAGSTGMGNSESIDLGGRPGGRYYLDVYGYRGVSNPFYTLDIDPFDTGYEIDLNIQSTDFTPTHRAMIRQAADRWEQIITYDLQDYIYYGPNGQTAVDDLLIDVTTGPIDGTSRILALAGPDRYRTNHSPDRDLPYHGGLKIDQAELIRDQAGLTRLEKSGVFLDMVTHEIGHAVGFNAEVWRLRGLISGAGTTNPRFTGADTNSFYNILFHNQEAGVPVQAVLKNGKLKVGGHFPESVFDEELMSPVIASGYSPLSVFTVAVLRDMGYRVDYDAADVFTIPPPSIPSTEPTGSGWWGSGTQWHEAVVAASVPTSATEWAGQKVSGPERTSWVVAGSDTAPVAAGVDPKSTARLVENSIQPTRGRRSDADDSSAIPGEIVAGRFSAAGVFHTHSSDCFAPSVALAVDVAALVLPGTEVTPQTAMSQEEPISIGADSDSADVGRLTNGLDEDIELSLLDAVFRRVGEWTLDEWALE